jgi:CheY-like chemotaxis protein
VRLLLSDLQLPGHDGLWLAQRVHEAEVAAAPGGAERTAIVICSGTAPPAAQAGVPGVLWDAWLAKPVEPRALADTVAALLGTVPAVPSMAPAQLPA